MPLRKTSNNCLDESTNRVRAPQRTGSLKSSGKHRPPLYRPPSEVLRQPSNNPITQDGMAQPIPQPSDSAYEFDKTERKPIGKNVRGIPTAEIIGSSVKESTKSESKSEPTKRISRLPRVLASQAPKQKTDQTNHENRFVETPNPHSQSRRNSFERPSYYNSLCKGGKSQYSGVMSKSAILPEGHTSNYEFSSDMSAPKFDYNRLDKNYSSSKICNGDNYTSDINDQTARPYSTLGRTFSYKGPSVKTYINKKTSEHSSGAENETEVKKSHSLSTNIARVSSLREANRSRLLRPQSLYESPDFNYKLSDIEKQDLEQRQTHFGRRIPVYHRSVSLSEGGKSDNSRHSSNTPDLSVLGKFFIGKKENEPEELPKDESNKKCKSRKISRFLRPDFYDTPKENSVYEKKEKANSFSRDGLWREKNQISSAHQLKISKKLLSGCDVKPQENHLSIVDRAIKSLKENSLKKVERESMACESNLIKRAVSLEDCSIVPENRRKRASSLTPVSTKTTHDNSFSPNRFENIFQKKKVEDFKKIVDQKLSKTKDLTSGDNSTQESLIKKLVRKVSPKTVSKYKSPHNQEEKYSCNGKLGSSALEDIAVPSQETRSSRLSKIAGLKRLEFTRPTVSADSTPSMEESKISGEFDDSSSFLSPTEDGSDTWSISSDYTDAREYNTSQINADESVSDRIRRKSFYSRFNQSKRRKPSQTSQFTGSRTRLPIFSRSVSSDSANLNLSIPGRKKSDPETPI